MTRASTAVLMVLLAEAAPASATPPPPQQQPSSAAETRTAQRTTELPAEHIAGSEFPGSFPIPNSDAALRIGGLVHGTTGDVSLLSAPLTQP